MNCPLLAGTETCIPADSEDAEARIGTLKERGVPMTLVVKQQTPADIIRIAAYDARNTLHVFSKVTPDNWTAPMLGIADRCGIRSAVTLYPVVPGAVQCVNVLEKVASLCVNRRTTFFFMFPKITLPVKRAGMSCSVGGRTVDARHLSRIGTGIYPSKDYTRRFMEKVHKYLDCTSHECCICGRDCSMCIGTTEIK